MKPIQPAFLLVAISLCTVATADDQCAQDHAVVPLTQCLWQKYRELDARLNEVYLKVLGGFSRADVSDADKAKAKAELVSAQRAWIKFREADCAANYTVNGGGNGSKFSEIDCETSHTKNRIRDLEKYQSYFRDDN